MTSRDAYGLTVEMLGLQANLTRIRSRIWDRTVAFRERVEAELDR